MFRMARLVENITLKAICYIVYPLNPAFAN